MIDWTRIDWAPPLAAAIAGILTLAGTLAGMYLTNRANRASLNIQLKHQSEKERIELFRARVEELYELLDLWLKNLFSYYHIRGSVIQGIVEYDIGLVLENENHKAARPNFGRIKMLIDLYFPAVQGKHDELIRWRDSTNTHIDLHKHAYEQGETDGRHFFDPFVSDSARVLEAGRVLREAIIAQARALGITTELPDNK